MRHVHYVFAPYGSDLLTPEGRIGDLYFHDNCGRTDLVQGRIAFFKARGRALSHLAVYAHQHGTCMFHYVDGVENEDRMEMGKDNGDEMRRRIKSAMRATWDAIGGDVLSCGESGRGTCGNELVIEMVLDADRVGDYGGDKEAWEALKAMDWDARNRLAAEVFPEGTYD